MVDIAHISGLVATKQHPSSFKHGDFCVYSGHEEPQKLQHGPVRQPGLSAAARGAGRPPTEFWTTRLLLHGRVRRRQAFPQLDLNTNVVSSSRTALASLPGMSDSAGMFGGCDFVSSSGQRKCHQERPIVGRARPFALSITCLRTPGEACGALTVTCQGQLYCELNIGHSRVQPIR